MFKRESSSDAADARRRLRWRLLVIPVVLWSWMACDTVAEITFIKESLKSVTVLGYRPDQCVPGADPLARCQGPGCGKLDFVLESTEGRFLTPNLQIVGLEGRLEPGTNFGLDDQDIEFDRSWLFELDALGQDKDCGADASVCTAPFTCQSLSSQDLPGSSANIDAARCVLRAQVTETIGAVRFDALGGDPQPENDNTSGRDLRGVSLVLAMDNSGSLQGKSDGGDGPIVEENKTDPGNRRIAAMISFLSELTADGRSTLEGDLEYGVFELAGSSVAGVRDIFEVDVGTGATFHDDLTDTEDALQDMADSSSGLTPVWESFIEAAADFEADEDPPRTGFAHQVLAVLDSEPDGSSETRTVQSAIDALAAADASATIVHFDYPLRGDVEERTGPLADYHRLACERGGYYVYELFPEALAGHLRRLGVGYEGVWSVDIQVTAEGGAGGVLELEQLPPGWYRLATVMTLRLADRSDNFPMMLESVSRFEVDDKTADSRLLFHVPDAGNDTN